jgi:hypothetical protein
MTSPVGYISVNTLQLVSGCHQNMFRIAFHEEFPTDAGGSAAPFHACNGSRYWTDAIDKANWAPGTTDDDGILKPDDPQASFDGIVYSNGGSPSPSPPVTIPGPRQTPPQPLNMNAQAYSSLFIFVGSQDTANLGKYWPAEPLMQVRYTDHGRDESGSWGCPAP